MAQTSVALPPPPAVPVRESLRIQSKPVSSLPCIWVSLPLSGTPPGRRSASAFCCTPLFGGLGICVGYHRLLTHRSFKCSKAVEYTLALLGTLTLEGGPIDWVAHHRQHHQYSDEEGDPHSARDGFFWSHVLWMFWTPNEKDLQRTHRTLYAGPAPPALLSLPGPLLSGTLHRCWPSCFTCWAAGLLWCGACACGWSITYHSTWFVNSASHTFGYRNFDVSDLSTNCWWVALLTYGEGWHNNHHAFPTSARHGLRPWEVDLSYGFIRLLKSVGLAWDVRTPPAERLRFESTRKAA